MVKEAKKTKKEGMKIHRREDINKGKCVDVGVAKFGRHVCQYYVSMDSP